MALANENYLKTPEIYGFDEIEKRINAYRILNPNSELRNIGLGDVTLPLIPEVVKAMHLASDELSKTSTFKGYGPPKGYDFLISKIQKNYKTNGIAIFPIFFSNYSNLQIFTLDSLESFNRFLQIHLLVN